MTEYYFRLILTEYIYSFTKFYMKESIFIESDKNSDYLILFTISHIIYIHIYSYFLFSKSNGC